METLTVTVTAMAHGGPVMGRDKNKRAIFVPFTIPGEQVRVEIVDDKGRYARARLLEVVQRAPERVEPLCRHFGPCGGCHYQHIDYPAQLTFKEAIVRDQLERIGRLPNPLVKPTLANPKPYYYGHETHLSPAPEGGLGYWSPSLQQVMPITECHIIRPELLEMLQDVDLELPGLRKLTLRIGDDGALLAALEIDDMEAPELEADFPVSVALVMPDDTAVNLIGDNYTVQAVKGHDFRVTVGAFFYPSPPAIEAIVDTVLNYAALTGSETLIEAYSGVGTLTAFLSPAAGQVIAIELNPDMVADAAVNLEETDNVSLYEGYVEEILPDLTVRPEVIVVDPPDGGLSTAVIEAIVVKQPARLIYVSSDAATLARDGRQLAAAGYHLIEAQPIDMFPQTFRIQTVSLWQP